MMTSMRFFAATSSPKSVRTIQTKEKNSTRQNTIGNKNIASSTRRIRSRSNSFKRGKAMLVKAAGHEDIAARFRAERAAAAAAKAAENSKAVESTPPPPEKTNKVEHEDKTAFYAMAMKRHAEKLLENERAKKANYPMFRTTDVDKNFAEFSTKCDGLMRLFGATGTLFVLDKVISKKVLSQGISFPGPLVVMFGLMVNTKT